MKIYQAWGLLRLFFTMKFWGLSIDLRSRLKKKNFLYNPAKELRKVIQEILRQADLETNPVRKRAFEKMALDMKASADKLDNLGVLAMAFFPDKAPVGLDEVSED